MPARGLVNSHLSLLDLAGGLEWSECEQSGSTSQRAGCANRSSLLIGRLKGLPLPGVAGVGTSPTCIARALSPGGRAYAEDWIDMGPSE